jgi:hypothetical protein
MTTTTNFSDSVFNYINIQYGKNTLIAVKSEKNRSTVDRLIESSSSQDNDVSHAANKIIAMLRINP